MKKVLLNKLNEYQSHIDKLKSLKGNLRDRSTCVLSLYPNMKNKADVHISLKKLLYADYNEDTDEVKALGEYNTNELDPNLFNDIVDAVRSICDKYAKKYEDAMDKALKEQSEEKEV